MALYAVYSSPIAGYLSPLDSIRNPRDGLHGVWNGSGGLTYNSSMLPPAASGANMSHAQAHVWSGTGWASQIWAVGSHDASSKTIVWSKGGFQDARASPAGAEWYIENVRLATSVLPLRIISLALIFYWPQVFELLDGPNEYYFSPEAQQLYFYYNGTGQPSGDLVATKLQTYLSIEGTLTAPVKNVTIRGIAFRDAAETGLEPHGVPSCGDWALQRLAAVFIEGTEGTTVDSCSFTRMDGNALMFSRYNRYSTVSNSEFAFIGDSAMAVRVCGPFSRPRTVCD